MDKNFRHLRKSLFEDMSGFKRFIPGFISRTKSRLHRTIFLPVDKPWTGGTNSGLTVGATLQGTGNWTSQQLIQTDITEDAKKDVDCVKLIFNHSGSVRYFISNDASNYPVEVTASNAIYRLPKSDDSLNNFQSKFNDLRVRIVLDNATVTNLKIIYSLIG